MTADHLKPETADDRVKKLLLIADELLTNTRSGPADWSFATKEFFAQNILRALVPRFDPGAELLVRAGRDRDLFVRATVVKVAHEPPLLALSGRRFSVLFVIDDSSLESMDVRLTPLPEHPLFGAVAELIAAATYASRTGRTAEGGEQTGNRAHLEQAVTRAERLLSTLNRRFQR